MDRLKFLEIVTVFHIAVIGPFDVALIDHRPVEIQMAGQFGSFASAVTNRVVIDSSPVAFQV